MGQGAFPNCRTEPHGNRTQQVAERQRLSAVQMIWLGGRDSNPDNVVQSHVSYR